MSSAGRTVPKLLGAAWIGLALCQLSDVLAAERTVLLMTSPRASELKNIANLVERGYLQVPELKLLGVHHAAEWSDYRSARAFVRAANIDWIELKTVHCDLSDDAVFSENDCSAELERLFRGSDGIVFTGGPDMPPKLYGQATRLTTSIADPPRHRFEISFLVHLLVEGEKSGRKPLLAARPDYLVVGLCLGMQSMNVALGGSLYQDIPSQIYGLSTLEQYARLPAAKRHRSVVAQLNPAAQVGWGHLHPVRFGPHPWTERLLPDSNTVSVLSIHHQAVRRIGRGLRVWATSTDGKVVEALVHRRWPAVFGIQFHPEKRILYDADQVYRQRENAAPANFVSARLAEDPAMAAFHRRFWQLVSTLLAKSAAARGAR